VGAFHSVGNRFQFHIDASINIAHNMHVTKVAQMTPVRMAVTTEIAKTLQMDLLRDAGFRPRPHGRA